MAASDESPLTRLASRKGTDGKPYLSAPEVAAGERLRIDFTRGGLSPSVTQRWDDAPRTGGRAGPTDLSDAVLDCRRRVELALKAVGPELSGVLLDVCCFLKGTERVEAERQWPARSAKLMLKAGLSALARHYGLVHEAEAGRGAIRAWKG
ncbi:DUF6456 domain-containing protein [Aureimonas sp. SK2]|uniref:DUF6456 domain-containing protein n=1 Tax=Aureimonas sp. SK2 TaxID=3015992 RepID=UPI00387EAA8F